MPLCCAFPGSRQEVAMSHSSQVNAQHHKSLVEHFVRLSWNTGKFNLLQQLVTPDYVYHSSFAPDFKDFAGFSEYVKSIRHAIPDLEVTIEELMAEGDKAMSMSTFSGTFENPVFGFQPNNRIITFGAVSVWEFRRGRVCSQNTLVDIAELQRQLQEHPAGAVRAAG